MVFIELTRPSGKKILINTNYIILIEIGENEDKFWTHISTNYGSIWVRETVEQVIGKIKEVKQLCQIKKKGF